MVKILNAPKDITLINISMPIKMAEDMEKISKVIYGHRRSSSKWLNKCIAELKESNDYVKLILHEWTERGKNKPIKFSVPHETNKIINEIMEELPEKNRPDQLIIGSIIRTAILQGIINFKCKGKEM